MSKPEIRAERRRLRTSFRQLSDQDLRELDAPEHLQALKDERERLSGEVESFFTYHAAPYPPEPPAGFEGMWAWPPAQGRMSLPVLPELVGRPWNNAAANFLRCLRPSFVRVLKHGQARATDHRPWRVTVQLSERGTVESISQEVAVGLVGFREGHDAIAYLERRDEVLTAPRVDLRVTRAGET